MPQLDEMEVPLRRLALVFVAAVLAAGSGCTGVMTPPPGDGGAVDAGLVDAGAVDAGVVDAGVVDAGVVDAGVADGGWTPPYALPTPGTTVSIPIEGRNVAIDVRPAVHDQSSWQYALFQAYGGGSFSSDYSAGGAYVIAGTGGHGAPPCFGAALFDFTTGTWSYLPNANGFDEARLADISRTTETNGWPWLELTSVTTPQMPSPAHNYQLQISPPQAVLGGPKGAIVRTVGAAQITEGWDSPQSHQLDLATGLWSRASSNLVTSVFALTPYTDSAAAYDPTTKRIYFLLGELSVIYTLPYLDLVDGQWKSAGSFPEATGSGYVRTLFVDDARRLLIVVRSSGELWAFDLTNVAAGPTRLNVSGTVPSRQLRWELYPAGDGGDGSYYSFSGLGPPYVSRPYPLATLQALHKLTPPATSPLSGTWTFSEVPITGGLTAEYVSEPSAGAHHHTRFFYVPALRSFAWIPNGTGPVELIRP